MEGKECLRIVSPLPPSLYPRGVPPLAEKHLTSTHVSLTTFEPLPKDL